MMRRPFSSLACICVMALTTGMAPAATFALTGATLIDRDGKLQRGVTIVVAGDRIQAVGLNASIPPGTRQIDAHAFVVSGGLFDAASEVGLAEVGHDDEANDTEGGDSQRPVAPALRIADGFDPNATAVPVTRITGVTLAALVPSGGLIAGQGAVVSLGGGIDGEAMVIKPSIGLYGTLSPQDAKLAGAAGRGGLMAGLREVLALGHQAPPSDGSRLPFQLGMLDLPPLHELVNGARTFFLQAHRASDIRAALSLASEQRFRLVLLGAEEGWMVAAEIAKAGVPVIVDPFADLPTNLDRRGSRLDNAALLHQAGVRLAFGTWSATNARDLRQAAGVAVANGLPWEAAWQAVTREPAAIYGVGDRYGEVAPGMAADLVMWDGDPFEPGTDVKALYLSGQEISLEDRQTALARRYRNLPAR
jgi:imidazolonepropionase-like amidohydrolase